MAMIKDHLQTILRTTDPQDMCVMIPYGLQVLYWKSLYFI